MKRTHLKCKNGIGQVAESSCRAMGSCQGVTEEGDWGFKKDMTKGIKAKQEASSENQSKDDESLIILVNLLVGNDTGWNEKGRGTERCWILWYGTHEEIVHSRKVGTASQNACLLFSSSITSMDKAFDLTGPQLPSVRSRSHLCCLC